MNLFGFVGCEEPVPFAVDGGVLTASNCVHTPSLVVVVDDMEFTMAAPTYIHVTNMQVRNNQSGTD